MPKERPIADKRAPDAEILEICPELTAAQAVEDQVEAESFQLEAEAEQ